MYIKLPITFTITIGETMKKPGMIKKIGIGILFCLITILAFKFFIWNFWQLEWAAAFTKGVIEAPPAVNLTVTSHQNPCFKKSFAYNPAGNYYIINHFDIGPYIHKGSELKLSIDNRHAQSPLLYRFKTFNIAAVQSHFFVFTTRDCGIEEFVELKDSIFSIVNSLALLAVDKGEKEILYRLFHFSPAELKYGGGRVSVPLPVPLLKGRTYEIVFDYRLKDVTPNVIPIIRVSGTANREEVMPVYHVLEPPAPGFEGTYREARIVFFPRTDVLSPVLHLMIRDRGKRGAFETRAYFKNITVYKYTPGFQWVSHLPHSNITYSDVLDGVKEKFPGFIPRVKEK